MLMTASGKRLGIDQPIQNGTVGEMLFVGPGSVLAQSSAIQVESSGPTSMLGFFNTPAISQPSGDITAALSALGLVSNPTVPAPPPGNALYIQVWNWTTATSAVASQRIGINTNAWDTATTVNVSTISDDSTDNTTLFGRIIEGDGIELQLKTDASRFASYVINGPPVNNGTWWSFPVSYTDSGGALPGNNNTTQMSFLTQGGSGGSTPGGATNSIQYNTGSALGGFGSYNPTDNNITIGKMFTGSWKYANTYAVWGNSALDQTQASNFAIVQSSGGVTTLSSTAGNSLNLNSGGFTYVSIGGNAVASIQFFGASASASWVWYGQSGQSAPLHALYGPSGAGTQRAIGYLDAGFSNSTDGSYLGFVRLCAQDHNYGANPTGREGVRVGSTGSAATLGFYGISAVAQPSGDILVALAALGLVSSPILNATALSGQVPSASLGSGVASSSTYLKGNLVWATLPPTSLAVGGTPVTGSVIAGGHLYVDNTGTLNMDALGFNWDPLSKRMGLGGAPFNALLDITHNATLTSRAFQITNTGTSESDIIINSGTTTIYLGCVQGGAFLRVTSNDYLSLASNNRQRIFISAASQVWMGDAAVGTAHTPLSQLEIDPLSTSTVGLSVVGSNGQTAPLFQLFGTTTLPRKVSLGTIDAQFVNSTDATYTGRLVLGAWDYNAALREGIRIEGNGSATLMGFYGATAIVKPSGDIVAALGALGLVSSPTVSGGGGGSPGGSLHSIQTNGGSGSFAGDSVLTWDGTTLTSGNTHITASSVSVAGLIVDLAAGTPGVLQQWRTSGGQTFMDVSYTSSFSTLNMYYTGSLFFQIVAGTGPGVYTTLGNIGNTTLALTITNTARWGLNSSMFYPWADNTYNLGGTSNRIANGYFAGTVTANQFNTGAMISGNWALASTYCIFGNAALNQAVNGNFAVIQSNVGVTTLNSSSGNPVNICVNNNAYAIFGGSAAVAAQFYTLGTGASWYWYGQNGQTAPLHQLCAYSASAISRITGIIDTGFSVTTDSSYCGFIKLSAQDWHYGTNAAGREGIRIGTDATQALIGFFGVTPAARPTGGAATAGSSYTATEQTMLQTAYNALRTLGLLT